MTYSDAIDNFVNLLQTALNGYYAKHFALLTPPIVSIIRGRKYDKVITIGSQRMAYCFIDRKTGGILKGNWKHVEDTRERGNIYRSNPLEGCNPHGVDYLKLGNYTF